MTEKEFNEYLETMPIQDYIVNIWLKYSHESYYRSINELLVVESGGTYAWLSDWHEGEEDVDIRGCIAIDDVRVPAIRRPGERQVLV